MSIHDALLEVRTKVGVISNSDFNAHFKFHYRGIETILNKVGPALLEAGINVTPVLIKLDSRDVTTGKDKKRAREVTVTVAYTYTGRDGDSVTAVVAGEASDQSDSAVSKAMAVALRIAHIQVLQIPTGEIDAAGSAMVRSTDPVVRLKNEIWKIAEDRGWIGEGGDFTKLAEDFAEWSQGAVITEVDSEDLAEYRDHLKPPTRMRRQQ